MRLTVYLIAVFGFAFGVAGCASQPKSEPVMAQRVIEDPAAAQDNADRSTPVGVGGMTSGGVDGMTSGIRSGSLEDFQVNIGDRVYFEVDQYRLNAEAQDILRRQAAWLQSKPAVEVIIAGNCDERGTREYNLALGERRASAVKDYLVNLGVAANRIQTVSYGKERPIALGSNEASWAQNRNAHTQITSNVTG